jgi:superfamily II DNA or RNA helicase
MQLRPYQAELKNDIYATWLVAPNVLAVLPTGGGKTVLFGDILRDHTEARVAIAHRQELVGQISLALARYGVRHNIIGPKNVIKFIVSIHVYELGASFYDAGSPCAVAGVDTLLRRKDDLAVWCNQVRLWVQDEAHHVLIDNKWGKAADLFPNAKGLGVTANTTRADGKGLGRHADGLMDAIVEGPGMRDLIEQGYLTDYRIYSPPSDLDMSGVKVGKDGEYNQKETRLRIKKSHVIGDVVKHYKRLADGKLGITFARDVETATEIAGEYNAAGVPAEVVTAKTPDKVRTEILRRFRNRELKQLVNVDLFGEGFDVPAIEVVSMVRPTESFNLFCQQFGRALRIMEGKTEAIIIDHVGNCVKFAQTHGLPDSRIAWSLDRREKRSRSSKDPDLVPVKACPGCSSLYEAIHKVCPYCGYERVPAARTAPEFVDGDLCELDAATLAALRDARSKIDRPADAVRAALERGGRPYPVAKGAANRHAERQKAQVALRESIALWAGHRRAAGYNDSMSYREFYFMFNTDVLTAQTLGRPEAELLTERINNSIGGLSGQV